MFIKLITGVRPVKYNYNEVRGFEERARHMVSIAKDALKTVCVAEKPGFKRSIARVPIGPVVVIGAWNYPYLVTVNAVIPAILAGNFNSLRTLSSFL